MSILIDKNTRVMTQGITGKTGMFHTKTGKEYANGANCYVAGVNPKKPGESYEGIPIFGTVREAKEQTGANVSVIYVPPAFAADAIMEAAASGVDCVKFQTFKAQDLATERAGKAAYQQLTTGTTDNQLAMLKALELSPQEHLILREHCREHRIE